MLNNIHIALTVLIALLFASAYYLGRRSMRTPPASDQTDTPPSIGSHARLLIGLGTAFIVALLCWRIFRNVRAAIDYLDSFLLLSFLLAAALYYLRGNRRLAALSFHIIPMIVLILLLGAILEIIQPESFYYERAWNSIHLISIILGTLCFALACVAGIVYLTADHRLKNKKIMGPVTPSRFPSLASLEKFTRWTVYPGFFLLTIAIAAGALSIGNEQPRAKIAFALTAWLIYALLLPRAPAFRGKRSAWLSIIGFIFILACYVAASWFK